MALTPRQQRFVDAYDGNGTAAARAAGYTGSDAVLGTQAYRLLKNAEVAAAIRSRENARAKPNILSRAERQEFWSDVVRDVGEDINARLKASELLGKSEADFTDRLSHEGNVNIVVGHPYEGEQ